MASAVVIVAFMVLWVVLIWVVVIVSVNWMVRGGMNWRIVLVSMMHVVLEVISETRCSISQWLPICCVRVIWVMHCVGMVIILVKVLFKDCVNLWLVMIVVILVMERVVHVPMDIVSMISSCGSSNNECCSELRFHFKCY